MRSRLNLQYILNLMRVVNAILKEVQTELGVIHTLWITHEQFGGLNRSRLTINRLISDYTLVHNKNNISHHIRCILESPI